MNRSASKLNTIKDNVSIQSTKVIPTTGGTETSRKNSKLTSKQSTKSLNKAGQKTSGTVSLSPNRTNATTPPVLTTESNTVTTEANMSKTVSTTNPVITTLPKKGSNIPRKSRIPPRTTNYSARHKESGKEAATETTRKESLTTRSLSRTQSLKRTQSKTNLDEQNNKKSDPPNDTAAKVTAEHTTIHKPRTLRSGVPRRTPSTTSCAPLKCTSPSPRRTNPKSDKDNNERDGEVLDTSVTVPKVLSNAGDQEFPVTKETNKDSSKNTKAIAFDHLEKRLSAVQSEFWMKLNNMQRTTPDQIKGNYKFVAIVRNDHGELLIHKDDQTKAPAQLPAYSIKDFKEKLRSVLECCINEIVDNGQKQSTSGKSSVDKIRFTALNQLSEMVDELCSNDKPCDELIKMRKELQDAQKAAKQAEKKLNEAQKVHEDKIREMEKARCEIESQSKVQILELKKTIRQLESQKNTEHTDKKSVEDELKTAKISMSSLTKKVREYEATLKKDKEDLKQKDVIIENMNREIAEHAAKVNELKTKQKINTTQAQQIQEHQKEIKELKAKITQLTEGKEILERKLQSIKKIENSESEFLSKLSAAELRIAELQNALEVNKQIPQISPYKDNQLEMSKLKQSEAEKRREIEKLKIELSKAQYNIGQLEEQIQRDQKLLDVRSKLINSLQTNDKDQRLHVEELYAKVGEKNTAINELNNELKAKTEEFRNLFSTVSAKQMELSNQEHMIKLLEESNERSQMLRVKQEEKIARMEEEMAHLKQTIRIYQQHCQLPY